MSKLDRLAASMDISIVHEELENWQNPVEPHQVGLWRPVARLKRRNDE